MGKNVLGYLKSLGWGGGHGKSGFVGCRIGWNIYFRMRSIHHLTILIMTTVIPTE